MMNDKEKDGDRATGHGVGRNSGTRGTGTTAAMDLILGRDVTLKKDKIHRDQQMKNQVNNPYHINHDDADVLDDVLRVHDHDHQGDFSNEEDRKTDNNSSFNSSDEADNYTSDGSSYSSSSLSDSGDEGLGNDNLLNQFSRTFGGSMSALCSDIGNVQMLKNNRGGTTLLKAPKLGIYPNDSKGSNISNRSRSNSKDSAKKGSKSSKHPYHELLFKSHLATEIAKTDPSGRGGGLKNFKRGHERWWEEVMKKKNYNYEMQYNPYNDIDYGKLKGKKMMRSSSKEDHQMQIVPGLHVKRGSYNFHLRNNFNSNRGNDDENEADASSSLSGSSGSNNYYSIHDYYNSSDDSDNIHNYSRKHSHLPDGTSYGGGHKSCNNHKSEWEFEAYSGRRVTGKGRLPVSELLNQAIGHHDILLVDSLIKSWKPLWKFQRERSKDEILST